MDDGKPERRHEVRLANALREMSDSDQMAGAQAFEMAKDVASILGADFTVADNSSKLTLVDIRPKAAA
ncbi:hypothetical protein [Comamonas aquatica]|uniref:hypothetical protein n=1 Tax=Comamonas aquatica TaxID=225991 RepID=UPI001B39AC2F|nr:hypothetical protein [Comamonas aquatica]QTX22193.1 hypothetical protein KAQ61_07105 [Comamonas aquatica]